MTSGRAHLRFEAKLSIAGSVSVQPCPQAMHLLGVVGACPRVPASSGLRTWAGPSPLRSPTPGNSESTEVPARLPEVVFQLQRGAMGSRASMCLNLHICKMGTVSQPTSSGCLGWRHERVVKGIEHGHISPWHVIKCSVRLGDISLSSLLPPPCPGSVPSPCSF